MAYYLSSKQIRGKLFYLKGIFFMFLVMCGIQTISAYDFEKDGICYNILSEEAATVEMTYRCKVVNNNWDDDGMRYTGEITLPPKVTYNGKEYKVVAIGKNAAEWGGIIKFIMPETLVEIKDSAFIHCGLGKYTLPHSLRKIGDSAFVNSYFYETELPDSLEEIGYSAFYACTMRDTLVIPNSVKKIGDFAFACNGMKKAVLPKNLERIGSGMFYNCEWLKEVVMPQKVTEIGDRAFLDCGWLSRLELLETVKRIGEYAFDGCNLRFKKLPDSLEYVGLGAFSFSFDSLTIPANLDTIEGGALTVRNSFKVHPANKSYKAVDDCLYTVNMDSIISVPTDKTEVNVPYGVGRIGAYAFRGSKIKDIVLPNSLRVIGKAAFEGSHLASISLPDSIEIIMEWAFSDCHYLEDVKLPANLRLIKMWAFYNTLGGFDSYNGPYSKLILPRKLESIGRAAFIDSRIDTVVSLNPTPPKLESRVFEEHYATNTLIVPSGSRELYANAEEWKDFDIIKESDFASVSAVESDNIQIEICDGMIRILGKWDETPVEVYDFSGRLLHSGNTPEIHGLPAGIYILKIGSLAKKIVV